NIQECVYYPEPGDDISDIAESIEKEKKEIEGIEETFTATPTPTVSQTAVPVATPSVTPTLPPTSAPASATMAPTLTPSDEIVTAETEQPSSTATVEITDASTVQTADVATESSATPSEDNGAEVMMNSNMNVSVVRLSNPVPVYLTEDSSAVAAVEEDITVFASNTVVAQYPPAGSVIYEWETVYIYFYDEAELRYLEGTELLKVEYPSEVASSNTVTCISAEYTLQNGAIAEESFDSVQKSEFPVEFNIPFAYGTEVTQVDIYVYNNNVKNHYKRVYVYKND
ncbi:MAG: hypothetical protein IJZ90_02925, partial [Clostridia bacterium]|nr:hypothetical protein [Clostridia bacterium]